ncbi:MAG: cysteine hydrolase [Candidatus Levybacteria bacterium]|nr:cysteine hydrolase [Candidatus Levybacteria bacterium]
MRLFNGMTKNNTALIVIDIINSCVHEKCEIPEWNIHFQTIRTMVPKLVTFIDDYRKYINSNVILTTTVPWRKEFLPDNLNELYKDPKAYYYSKDTTGFAEEFYLVKPQPTDKVIAKSSYDAFSQTDLDEYLQKRNIKYLIVTGVFTDGCVMATIINGFAKGYNFVVLKDLIETTDDPERKEIQKYFINRTFPIMYGRTLTSSDFLQMWQNKLNNY